MNASLFASLIDAAILLFFFGILARSIRSNWEIPVAAAKFCSLYRAQQTGAYPSAITTPPLTARSTSTSSEPLRLHGVLHEAFTDGAHLRRLGGILIGYITGEEGKQAMKPFTDLQKGVLAFFLLDMRFLVASRARELRHNGIFLGAFGDGTACHPRG